MTLKELAAASGVSVSMLSQVERGRREPTLPIALRIAEGLGCHLSELLDEPPQEAFGLVRLADASGTVDPESGVRRLLLSRQLPPSVVEVTWYRVPPRTTLGPFVHRDTELYEQLTVIEGRLEVTVGAETHRLRGGDTLSYSGGVEHRFENPGRTETSFVHLAHPRRGGGGR
jgi:transcriptional regulator with XRE-family HTH domain